MSSLSAARILLTYAVGGPFVGGVVVVLGTGLSEPDVLSVTWGAFAGTVLLMAYPFGIAQALAAGIGYAVAARLLPQRHRAYVIAFGMACGVLASIVLAALLGSLGRVFDSAGGAAGLLVPPCLAALIVGLYVSSRKHVT